MTSTTRSLRRQRFAAAALSLPLALSLTGTALAGGAAGELRGAAATAAEVAKPEATGGPKAQPQAEQKAEPKTEPKTEQKAEPKTKPARAASAPAKGADSSSSSDKHGTATSGPLTTPQPLSNADKNNAGANPGETCTHAYCSTRDGSASQNGKGGGEAGGKPCAGCVGRADNKNPKGQAPNGTDHNAGYECDRNQGIGKSNPAHTGCTSPTSTPTSKPTSKPTTKPTTTPTPKPTPSHGTATITVQADCRSVVVTSSKDISNVVVVFVDGTSQKFDGLSGHRWSRTFSKDVRSATAKSATTSVTGVATGCGVAPVGTTEPSPSASPTCPDGSAMPAGGKKDCGDTPKDVRDNAQDKVTICHATGSATNPYVIISPSKQGVLAGHVGHQDGRDVIPPFSYVEDGVTKQFSGQNWTSAGYGACTAATPSTPTNPVSPTVLTCPNGATMPGNDPANCPTTPPVCPTVPVMGPVMAGCHVPTQGGGTPIGGQPPALPANGPANPVNAPGRPDAPDNAPVNPGLGGGTPIAGQPAAQPVTVGPPTQPKVLAHGSVTPIAGTPAAAAARARVTPSALPFTGTDAALLIELGALLLLVGGGVTVVARRERSARAAA